MEIILGILAGQWVVNSFLITLLLSRKLGEDIGKSKN